jgi:hypothetical protein
MPDSPAVHERPDEDRPSDALEPTWRVAGQLLRASKISPKTISATVRANPIAARIP